MSPTSCHCSTPRHRPYTSRANHYLKILYHGGCAVVKKRICVWVHGPTLPTAVRQYYRRCDVSRPGSGWSSVVPSRSTHTHTSLSHFSAFGRVAPAVSACIAHQFAITAPQYHARACKEALDSAPSSPLLLTEPPARSARPSLLLGVLLAYSNESTLLEAHFPLRCFQRFVFPNVATEPAGRPTTPPPAVRPARSSRTRASPSQYSRRP